MHRYLQQKHLLSTAKAIAGSNKTLPKFGTCHTDVPSHCFWMNVALLLLQAEG